jgi:hypothetical protein
MEENFVHNERHLVSPWANGCLWRRRARGLAIQEPVRRSLPHAFALHSQSSARGTMRWLVASAFALHSQSSARGTKRWPAASALHSQLSARGVKVGLRMPNAIVAPATILSNVNIGQWLYRTCPDAAGHRSHAISTTSTPFSKVEARPRRGTMRIENAFRPSCPVATCKEGKPPFAGCKES